MSAENSTVIVDAANESQVHEGERTIPISYDRTCRMAARLVAGTMNAEVVSLADGYFVARRKLRWITREMTVRLGREGADTRVGVRVASATRFSWEMVLGLVVGAGVMLAGLVYQIQFHGAALAILVVLAGVMCLSTMMARMTKASSAKEALGRELLLHAMLRTFEEAAVNQGVADHYRVAPGADRVSHEEPDEEPVGERRGL